MFLCSTAKWEIFEQHVLSEKISSLILESEGGRGFCSQGVHGSWQDGPHIRGNYIKKKRHIFHQDKKWLCRGTWNGCICWLSLQNTWKEVREMNEKRQGGTRTAWMQPSAQEVHDWQVSKRQGRVGKYKKDVEYWLFSIFLAFLPSLDSTGFWSRRSFCPSQSEILYIPTLSRDWHINKKGPSTTIKANYVQRQFVAERWSWKIYLNSYQNKNEFRDCIC